MRTRVRHALVLGVVGALSAVAACQQGERSVGAISPRSESERAFAATTRAPAMSPASPTGLGQPLDPWAPREPAYDVPWADALTTAARDHGTPASAFEWQPGRTLSFGMTQEPVAAASAGAVVSALSSNQSLIAVSEDGSCAVTVDVLGGARLWPTLDGTREPVVIALHAAEQIAVAQDGDAVIIAAIDHAGQLELLRLARTGEVRGHAWVESPRPLSALWFAGQTLLAMRDDHAIAAFDARGAGLGVLVADPGEHIGTLAVRSGRALAILDAEGEVRGRWVDLATGLAAGLAWGDRTAALGVLSSAVALTPDGTRLAGVDARHRAILIVDIASGRLVRRALRRDDPDLALRPAGFLTSRVLAIGSSFVNLEWWGREMPETELRSSTAAAAIADGVAVGDDMGSLVVIGASGPGHFLGYRTATLGELRPYGTHFLATDTSSVIELDEKLHTYRSQELPIDENGRPWSGITLLDKTHVVANHYVESSNGLFLVDLPSTKATLIAARASVFGYQPTTHLLEYQVDNLFMVARFDPKTGTLGAPASMPVESPGPRLDLLDPTISNGNVAVLTSLSNGNTRVHVTLIKSIDPTRAEQFERGASRDFRVDDDFWQTHTEIDLAARMVPPHRPLSPDKQLSAEIHDLRITLRDRGGTERWTVPSRGATTLVWTPQGDLVAYGAGAARLDLATGEMIDRQCGWRFGRWDEAPQSFGTAEQCEAR